MAKWNENIRNLRKERGWNQSELARRVGYSDKSMISKIEKGDVDLPRSQIFKFAKALNVTASEIMGEADLTPSFHTETHYVKRHGKLFPEVETVMVIDDLPGISSINSDEVNLISAHAGSGKSSFARNIVQLTNHERKVLEAYRKYEHKEAIDAILGVKGGDYDDD